MRPRDLFHFSIHPQQTMVVADTGPEGDPLTAVLRRLQDHAAPPDPETLRHCYPQQWTQLAELVQRAAGTGESNSALIVGPRGVGKTAVRETVAFSSGQRVLCGSVGVMAWNLFILCCIILE